jgi:ammonia channel protein AmtB
VNGGGTHSQLSFPFLLRKTFVRNTQKNVTRLQRLVLKISCKSIHNAASLVAGYQGMFAVIAPALMTGAFADRMNFAPYLVYIFCWIHLVYFPFCHWWGLYKVIIQLTS